MACALPRSALISTRIWPWLPYRVSSFALPVRAGPPSLGCGSRADVYPGPAVRPPRARPKRSLTKPHARQPSVATPSIGGRLHLRHEHPAAAEWLHEHPAAAERLLVLGDEKPPPPPPPLASAAGQQLLHAVRRPIVCPRVDPPDAARRGRAVSTSALRTARACDARHLLACPVVARSAWAGAALASASRRGRRGGALRDLAPRSRPCPRRFARPPGPIACEQIGKRSVAHRARGRAALARVPAVAPADRSGRAGLALDELGRPGAAAAHVR